MILPTKHLDQRRSLIHIGAEVLTLLAEPAPVTALWDRYKRSETGSWTGEAAVPFDWFVLALDLLYAIDAVDLRDGRLAKR